MKYVSLELSTKTTEVFGSFETDLGDVRFGILLGYNEFTGYYFPILLDENQQYVEALRMEDESTETWKVFRTNVEHGYLDFCVTVEIDTNIGAWHLEIIG